MLDEKEKVAVNMIIEGKVKHGYEIKNRQQRYAYMLWEFWKKDEELFPENLLN